MDPSSPIKQRYPLKQIYFYLTEGCNLACRHCWLAPRFDPSLKNTTFLPVELYEQVITEAKPLGLRGVKLTGGEPFLHPHFEKLLKITRQAELSLTIETNGVLCTSGLVEQIADFPVRNVSVSLDGADAATHEAIRGVSGSFKKACQALEMLSRAGVELQVIFSVMRSNVNQIEAIIILSEQCGARSLKFNIIQPTSRGEQVHQQGNALSVSEYISLGRLIENELSQKTNLTLFFDYPPAFHSLRRIISDKNNYCGILNILGILPDGKFALCGIGEILPDFVFGKSGVDSLAYVWENSLILQKLRQGLPGKLEGICHDCLMVENCLGSCIAQNMYSAQNLWAPFWFCREAEVKGLFPISRRQ